ncbi:MAG: galactokinase family protein [Desulfurococcaceae archaeon]
MYSESASRVDYVVKEFEKVFGTRPQVVASAPGRLDLLNTHQDYKGLPVVSVAINKRTYVALSESKGKSNVLSVNLCMENIECVDTFSAKEPVLRERGFFGNYIRSIVYTLRGNGLGIGDFNMLVYSEIPMASGLASSAALQVATLTGLNELYGLSLERKLIAELAYQSEHDVVGVPCGRLDQYGSVMGGVTKIETKPPYDTVTYRDYNWTFVVLNSGIRRSVVEVHPKRISEIEMALRKVLSDHTVPGDLKAKMSTKIDEVAWGELRIEELEPYLNGLEKRLKDRIIFTIKMNESTKLALRLLENPHVATVKDETTTFLKRECRECLEYSTRTQNSVLALVAGIINYQHLLLRDLYEVSLPELEVIRDTALKSGALGVKISGAGLGGSLLAVVDSWRDGGKVVKGVREVVRSAWVVHTDEGARVDLATK